MDQLPGGFLWDYRCFGVQSYCQEYSSSLNHRTCIRLVTVTLSPYPNNLSSRHLLGTGRQDEARLVIAQLNGLPEDDPIVIDQIEELEYGIHQENDGGKPTWFECFSTRNMLWKRTINGMMLQFIQQLNGQNFYCTSF